MRAVTTGATTLIETFPVLRGLKKQIHKQINKYARLILILNFF